MNDHHEISRSVPILRNRFHWKKSQSIILGVLFFLITGLVTGSSNSALAVSPYEEDEPYKKIDIGKDSHKVEFLNQGVKWDAHFRELFYYTPQGSRLIPYDWFLALEQPGSTKPFSDLDYLESFGWIPPARTESKHYNPDNLPVGFTKDPVKVPETGHWLGFTCAACHTNDIKIKDKTLRINGAPSLADWDSFMTQLSLAVRQTRLSAMQKSSPGWDRFQRFASNVLQHSPTPAELKEFAELFLRFSTTFEGHVWLQNPPFPPGPGRVDALGKIINTLSVIDLKEESNLRPNSAPVSYPFLWYTPHLKWVQWNPIASVPINRNAGEVLGVFGCANFDPRPHSDPETASTCMEGLGLKGAGQKELFASTVLLKNLYELEQWVADLEPPPWPEKLLGSTNSLLAHKGHDLFQKHCRGCHNMKPFDMTSPEENIKDKQFIKIKQIPYNKVGTDPVYVENLITRLSKTGSLKPVLGAEVVPTLKFFLGSVSGAVKFAMAKAGLSKEEILAYEGYRYYKAEEGQKPKKYRPTKFDTLKAGPLHGIWATGPFLHNGSVPNIYELLSPAEERSKVFWVGNNELDSEKLGFVSTEKKGLFKFDTQIRGNGNQGHEYPKRPLAYEEKMAIIEYLKDPSQVQKKKEVSK